MKFERMPFSRDKWDVLTDNDTYLGSIQRDDADRLYWIQSEYVCMYAIDLRYIARFINENE